MDAFSGPASEAASRRRATATVQLRHEAGLHARPAVKLTKLAKKFSSKIAMATSGDGPWIDAKSIVKVMAAKTPRDSILHFRAEGIDSSAAVEALVALVDQDFPDDG
jgi:phosphocarrier protein